MSDKPSGLVHRAIFEQLKADLAAECEAHEETKDALRRNGWRLCDVPACNCNSWHAPPNLRAQKAEEERDAYADDWHKEQLAHGDTMREKEVALRERDEARRETDRIHDMFTTQESRHQAALAKIRALNTPDSPERDALLLSAIKSGEVTSKSVLDAALARVRELEATLHDVSAVRSRLVASELTLRAKVAALEKELKDTNDRRYRNGAEDGLYQGQAQSKDRIAALEKELAECQESEFHPDWSMLKAARESLREHMANEKALEAKVKTLREALMEVAHGMAGEDEDFLQHIDRISRAALAATKEKP
jgi:hypothetical protein